MGYAFHLPNVACFLRAGKKLSLLLLIFFTTAGPGRLALRVLRPSKFNYQSPQSTDPV